ncbi:MAG TPA: isochorismatase family protein [Anaerolineae bacterium]|nr:isochorismatase family protein [Anaerolineae bacterium]
MATVREGNKPVLVVVDVQVGVVAESWDAPRVIGNVARAVQRARDEGAPVVWVQHADDDLPQGSPQWQWVPQLAPAAGERQIHKRFNSAFEDTELDAALAEMGTTHIVLAGAATNWCIRATAYAALDRGYDLTLLKDAHTTESMEFDDGTTIAAADVVRELNVAMTWLSYPGRKNAAKSVDEVGFAAA